MRPATNHEARLKLITTLWGLLLTKCFLLEFLVRHYEVPIHSLTYIWTLSILMAGVATAVYVNVSSESRAGFVPPAGFGLTVLSGLLVTLLSLWALLAPSGQGGLALALAALVLSLKHGWRVRQGGGADSRWLALGWLAAALGLAYFGTPVGFLLFALGLLCLMVVPGFSDFLARRKEPYSQQL
jgi:hypothetical protein